MGRVGRGGTTDEHAHLELIAAFARREDTHGALRQFERLESGDRAEANRLLLRALPLARFSGVAMHLSQRIYGTLVDAAADPVAAREMVDRAETTIGVGDHCLFCSIMLAVPSAKACAAVGDVEQARRHLLVAERSARRWEGTSWQAALLEVRAAIADAEHDPAAAGLRARAAELYESSGQPLAARRCR